MWELDTVEVIGLVAAVLTTSAFAPQVYHTWRTKDVAGLSLTMYIVFFTGVVLWTVYGIYKDSLAIILANFVTGILVIALLFLKLKHGTKK